MNLYHIIHKLDSWIQKKIKKVGFLYNSPNDSVLNIFANISISLIILILTAPISIVIAIIIKLQDRGPILYYGVRIGKDKKTFNMYKFRTLVPNAESIVGSKLLSPEMNLETPIGKFLRDSRLDEIPQLINVIKGDMVLIGPRPERPVVYDAMCKEIPDYDLRFKIKPGILGFSQLFTPHGADKRIRARIDNHYMKQNLDVSSGIIFVTYSLVLLFIIAVSKTVHDLKKKMHIFYSQKRFSDERKYPRVKFSFVQRSRILLRFDKQIGNIRQLENIMVHIFDVNDKFISIVSDYVLPDLSESNHCSAKMIVYVKSSVFERRKSKKNIFCTITGIEEQQRRNHQDSYLYLLEYKLETNLNRYKMDKYVLGKSIL